MCEPFSYLNIAIICFLRQFKPYSGMLRLAAKNVFRKREKLDPSVTGMANDIFSLMRLYGSLFIYTF